MSLLGNKTTTSIRKQNTTIQSNPNFGAKDIYFHHQSVSGGESYIDLTALNPSSTLLQLGYANPSSTELLNMRLSYYKKNLSIISSSKGELGKLSFDVTSNSKISFIGFTSEVNEVFECTVKDRFFMGNSVVDARPMAKTYTLAEGATTITLDEDFEYYKFPSYQIGAIMVFRGSGLTPQLRNVNNATATPGADGNYQEISGTGGVSRQIKFNDAGATGGENIAIISVGSLVERPTQSILSYLETVNGSLSTVIQVLADVAGLSTSYFNAYPTSVDLSTFAARISAFTQETFYNLVVGSTTQVSAGKATHSSLVSALAICPVNGRILVLPEYAGGESITISNTIQLQGKGRGSLITGTTTLNASYCTIKNLKFGDNVTINSGANGNFVRECFMASGKILADSGSGNSTLYIGE